MTIEKVAGLTIKVERTGIKEADKALDNLTKSGGTAQKATDRLATSFGVANTQAKKASGGFKVARNGMQQVGYQVQDIAVQLGAGQSPFIVLAQQGSQLAGIFGPGGALFGAVLAIGGVVGATLLPSLFDSKDATEQLEDALDSLEGTLKRTETGAYTASKAFAQLANTNASAALIQLDNDIIKTEKDINSAFDSIIKKADIFNVKLTSTGPAIAGNDVLVREAVGQISKSYGLAGDQIKNVIDLVNKLNSTRSQADLEALNNQLISLGLDDNASNELTSFSAEISNLVLLYNELNLGQQERLDLQEKIRAGKTLETEDTIKAASARQKSFDSFHNQMLKKVALYGEVSEAAKLAYTVENSGFTDEQKKTLNPLIQELAERELQASLLAQEKKDDAIANAEKEASKKSYDALLVSLLNEEKAIIHSYQKRVDLVKNNAKGGQIDENINKLNNQIGRKATDRLKDSFGLGKNASEKISLLNDHYAQEKSLIEQLEGDKTQLLLNLENQRNEQLKALRDQAALETLNNSESLFGSLSDITKNFAGEQSGTYKKLFALQKSFAVASGIISIKDAYLDAFSQGATIYDKIAGAATILSLASGVISDIQSVNFAGAFDNGGIIPSGSFGLVGEIGPELIEGPTHVTSRRKTAEMLKGNDKPVTVVVNNYGNDKAQVRELDTIDGKFIEVIVGKAADQANQKIVRDIAQGGTPIAKAMEGTYRSLKRGQG